MSKDDDRLADDAGVLIDRIPDVAEPMLGFRSWAWDTRHKRLASVVQGGVNWPPEADLRATCPHNPKAPPDKHQPPDKDCSCGIYAAYDIPAAAPYTGIGNVFGLVYGWGKEVVPAINGFRAQYARVAAILAVAPEVSLDTRKLRKIAQLYDVPLVTPFSVNVADYRDLVRGAGGFTDLTRETTVNWDATVRNLTEREGEQ